MNTTRLTKKLLASALGATAIAVAAPALVLFSAGTPQAAVDFFTHHGPVGIAAMQAAPSPAPLVDRNWCWTWDVDRSAVAACRYSDPPQA